MSLAAFSTHGSHRLLSHKEEVWPTAMIAKPVDQPSYGLLIAPFERLGRWLLRPVGRLAEVGSPAASPLREPVAEWRDLLYSNIAIFGATLFLLLLVTLAFAGVGALGSRLTGTHPAGRAYLTPFVFLEIASAAAASIYVVRLTFTIQKGTQVMKESRRMRSTGDTSEKGDLLRARFYGDYRRWQPRSADIVAAVALGIAAGTIAWLAN